MKAGEVAPGRKTEVEVIYSGEKDDELKTVVLAVPARKLIFPLKFIGKRRDPRIFLDRPFLNLGQRLVNNGAAAGTVTLVNEEEVPFSWHVAVEDLEDGVVVKPAKGVVPAKSRAEILVKVKPREEKIYNCNIQVAVRRVNKPLTLNVKCQGMTLAHKSL